MDETFKKFIKGDSFFPAYTTIKNHKHKLRGTDGNGKPISFSKDEEREIKVGLRRLFKELLKAKNNLE